MLSKKCLIAAITASCLASGAAGAAVINFQFSGTVTYGGTLASTGDQITGSFSYDTDASISDSYHASYSFTSPFGISATVTGHTIESNTLNVAITNDFGGNVEDMVDIYGNAVTVDGNTYANGSFGFRLASAPGNTNVLSDTSLPFYFDVSAFNAGPTQNYGWLQSDGGPNGQLLQFSIDSITSPVPVPSALWLFISGTGLLFSMKRKNNR